MNTPEPEATERQDAVLAELRQLRGEVRWLKITAVVAAALLLAILLVLLGGSRLLGGVVIWGAVIALFIAWAQLTARPKAPKRPATVILPKDLP